MSCNEIRYYSLFSVFWGYFLYSLSLLIQVDFEDDYKIKDGERE